MTLYDIQFKQLLEPERIGSFIHFALYDVLQSGLYQNIISMTSSLRQMMGTEKVDLDLTLVSKLFAINDFTNIELLEDYELKDSQVSLIKDCYNAVKIEQYIDEYESFNEKKKDESYLVPSPCLNLTENSLCRSYCEWHKNVVENWSRTKLNVIERYIHMNNTMMKIKKMIRFAFRLALPQDNVIQKSISNEKQTAEELFGKSQIANFSRMISGNNLVFFCKDSKVKNFLGDSIEGLNVAFCNRSKAVQTDVGNCVATDPIQYLENEKILNSDDTNYIGEGLKDAEHVIVLLVDKIGFTNIPPNYKVSISRTT